MQTNNGELKAQSVNLPIELQDWLKQFKVGLTNNKLTFKGKRVGYIGGDTVGYALLVFTQFDPYFYSLIQQQSEQLQLLAKAQLTANNCPRCAEGACSVTNIRFAVLDEQALILAKALIALRCDAILAGRVPVCRYIKFSDRNK